MKALLIGFIISILMTGCGEKANEIICTDIKDSSTCVSAQEKVDQMDKIRKASVTALIALKDHDTAKLNKIISANGIRFSPYSQVSLETDIVLTSKDIVKAIKEKKAFNRGSTDNGGYPITTTFEDYRTRYIYKAKFLTEGTPYINTKVQRGNIVNNVYDVYSGDIIVEYYIAGKSSIYQNMDWKSLTLVFTEEDGAFKLKAIINGERTM